MLIFVSVRGNQIGAIDRTVDRDFAFFPAANGTDLFAFRGTKSLWFSFLADWAGHAQQNTLCRAKIKRVQMSNSFVLRSDEQIGNSRERLGPHMLGPKSHSDEARRKLPHSATAMMYWSWRSESGNVESWFIGSDYQSETYVVLDLWIARRDTHVIMDNEQKCPFPHASVSGGSPDANADTSSPMPGAVTHFFQIPVDRPPAHRYLDV